MLSPQGEDYILKETEALFRMSMAFLRLTESRLRELLRRQARVEFREPIGRLLGVRGGIRVGNVDMERPISMKT